MRRPRTVEIIVNCVHYVIGERACNFTRCYVVFFCFLFQLNFYISSHHVFSCFWRVPRKRLLRFSSFFFFFPESPVSKTILVSSFHGNACLYSSADAKDEGASEKLKSVASTAVQNDVGAQSTTTEQDDRGAKHDHEYEENVKNKILEASLNFVAEHGWTKAAIVAGKLY